MLNNLIKNFVYLIKRFSYPVFFLFALFLMILFKNINNVIAYNSIFIIAHSVVFVLLAIFFIIFLVRYLIEKIKYGNIQKYNTIDIIYFIFVIFFSIFFVFVVLKDNFTGIFTELRWIVGNVFIKEVFQETLWVDPKTFTAVIYSVLQTIFHIKISTITVLTVNKVIAVLLLIVVFLISKVVFKKNIISLIVYATFISSSFVHWNIGTVSHSINGMFFTYASIIFLFAFMKQQKLTSFILSNICLLLAAYYRYEFSVLFGLSYIFYYCLFLKRYKRTGIYMTITTIILLLLVVFLVKSFTLYNETDRLVTEQYNVRGLSVIGQSVGILKHNILVQKDLSLKSGNATLFTYTGFIISLILVINVAFYMIKRREIKSDNTFIYIFAFYNLIYFIFVLAFTLHGLRISVKYSVQYWLCEIIVTYFGILWLVRKIALKWQKHHVVNIAKVVSIVLFLFIAVKLSRPLSFEMSPMIDPEGTEIYLLKENVKLDSSCEIIKVHPGQPSLDLYLGVSKNAVFFGFPPEFYENIKRYEKKNKCFYYHDQEYFPYDECKTCYRFKIDREKLDLLFELCNKSIEYKSQLDDLPFSLIKYSC